MPQAEAIKYERLEFKSTWKTEKILDYQQSFSNTKIMLLSEKIINQCLWDTTQDDIDQLTTELSSIILEPAKQVCICKKIRICNKARLRPRKPWFNEACERNRKMYFKSNNALWKNWNTKTHREKINCHDNMKEKGKSYKTVIAKQHNIFTKNLHKNVRILKNRILGNAGKF